MIGFLHTAHVHTATFTGLLAAISPQIASTHVVDETLLADAQARGGVDEDLRTRLTIRLREAAATASVVVCSCSTISGAAESLADEIGVRVIRVDRPMAEQAVALGPRIAVVAALASTIGPTTELLQSVASEVARSIEIVELACSDAWSEFESGDMESYLDAVARAVDSIDVPVDVVVLAQASMAGAVDRVHVAVPVLSSPRLAVEAAVRAMDGLAPE